MKRLLYYLLTAAGTVILFLGTRDLLESHFGQTAAARTFTPAAHPEPRRTIRLGDTVAKLEIPRLNTQLYVVEGDDDRDLRRGPGHMPGTALPGATGNSVIAGHRDTHFRVLKGIHRGDDIVIDTDAGKFLYRVSKISVVRPSNIAALKASAEPVLHLITCYPFYYAGPAPERFVVEARLAARISRVE
jgi:sortase A